MIHERISLVPLYDSSLNNGQQPSIATYFHTSFEYNKNQKRPLVIVCPGGGYNHLSEREGEAIALKFNTMGFHAAVLTYSLAPMTFPASLLDLAAAVSWSRKNSDKFSIDKNQIFVCGFSAGGHLAALLGAYWNSDFLQKKYKCDDLQPSLIKPNGLILCYPVITAGDFAHKASITNVLGDKFKHKKNLVSIEKLITKDFPQTFIWHTNGDQSVPAENTLLLVEALRKEKIPFEYHLFGRGSHGLALATEETSTIGNEYVEKECQVWPLLFKNWYDNAFEAEGSPAFINPPDFQEISTGVLI